MHVQEETVISTVLYMYIHKYVYNCVDLEMVLDITTKKYVQLMKQKLIIKFKFILVL